MSADPITSGVASAVARHAHVHEAHLRLHDGVDVTEPGAAVTVALCGRLRHPGPCPWPHNNAAPADGDGVRFRTVFLASEADEAEVRARIDGALHDAEGWSLLTSGPRAVRPAEQALADRLADTPIR